MSPTSPSRLLAGRNARSATLRTIKVKDSSVFSGYDADPATSPQSTTSAPPPPLATGCRPRLGARALCYVRAAVTASPANLRTSAAAAATALALAGCGGGDSAAGARREQGTVEVVRVSFPARQRVGQQTTFALTVRNAGDTAISDLRVTLSGFSERSAADSPQRPLWLVDEPPAGGATATTDTYATGELATGRRRTLRWRVTAVVAGSHELRYALGARLANGRRPRGARTVRIEARPAFARVDPRTGRVVRE